ncbi:mesenteric estrogen-dependent adipogenesis protein-like [Pseudoliparis swirei]|uniref:mesenteric estrogen-dependent adipogenesis protein-like n=1 Tax=Pseudoliparis swirei TaxID=2059687 RepID=UPI0024BE01B7|nr:mesenteric estrogen-dependent adipogenesis protein-like [Pseudoliparis swirei]XP_056300478.1 mesenteric estrogen-dependent adipogenesis protein-like [Pseudoliparis swirei]
MRRGATPGQIRKLSHSITMRVIEVEEFLRNPPAGFTVETLPSASGYRVNSDPESSLVLIDDMNSNRQGIVFQKSMGSKVKMHNLFEYTSMRNSLLSKRIYLLVSAYEGTKKKKKVKARGPVLKQFVVSIDGSDPFIKWQLEKGLDKTISSVNGESYRVEIDFTDLLESWAAINIHRITDRQIQGTPVWKDNSFTLKYYSDAFFDFPHWFGLSKRKFSLKVT